MEAGFDVEGDKVLLGEKGKLGLEASLVSSVAADGACRHSDPMSMAVDATGQREETLGPARQIPRDTNLSGANVRFQKVPVLVEAERECSEKADYSKWSRMDCGWRHQDEMIRSRSASKIKEIQSAVMLYPGTQSQKKGHEQTIPRKKSGNENREDKGLLIGVDDWSNLSARSTDTKGSRKIWSSEEGRQNQK